MRVTALYAVAISALALLRAELHVGPVAFPLFAPFKWQAATFADFRLVAILRLRYSAHASIIDSGRGASSERASKNPRVHSGAVAYGDYLLQLQLEPSVLAEQLQDEPQLQELFSDISCSFISIVCFV